MNYAQHTTSNCKNFGSFYLSKPTKISRYPAKHVPAIVKDFYTHSLDRSKAIEALNANSLSGSVKLPSIQNLMRNNASMTTMQGRHAVYPGEGFYFDLPLKRREAENVITELRSWDFLDKSTRAVIVENTVRQYHHYLPLRQFIY